MWLDSVTVKRMQAIDVERAIDDYLTQHPGSNWASEVADALGLNLSVTFEAIDKLLKEGRIKKAEKLPAYKDEATRKKSVK